MPGRLGAMLSRAEGAPRWRSVTRMLGLCGVALALSACRVEMAVRVESDAFGAGRVSVTAELDRDASAALLPRAVVDPGSTGQATPPIVRVQLDDLRNAGWEGPGLVSNADGSARFSLSHRFTTVRQANELLDQLSGPSGPLAGLRLQRTRSPLSTQVRLSGPGDFGGGLAAFGDAELGVVTGNGSFGLTDAEVLRQANATSLDDVFALRVDALLIDREQTWKLPVGAVTPMAMQTSSTSWGTIAGGVGALGAIVTLIGLQTRSRRPDAAPVADPASPVASVEEDTP